MYNPGVNFSQGSGIVYIPGRGLSALVIACISTAAVILLGVGIFVWYFRKKKVDSKFFSVASDDLSAEARIALGSTLDKAVESTDLAASDGSASGLTGMNMDKSVEFSYAELAKATDNFSMAHKIGEDTMHYLQLLQVRLIGYCIEGSLFLVYEFIENGNLGQHLRGSGNKHSLPWSARVQIALDPARGLEYIHEHTDPVYIHRDIKSAN
ncbi:hypothetical protein SO802_015423 [Lithocarpus litseifolius]|uniref:Protein kinase domain-containing protein n=1 Tax=Lithocarpus litseifolius TaxID=425828 RepID=A0AAW2CTM7_9ROSI